MPTKDKENNTWIGVVRKVGYPIKKKRGFKTKKEATQWEDLIRVQFKEFEIKSQILHSKNAPLLLNKHELTEQKSLRDKYKKFLDDPYNSLPDLIEMFFDDFDLPYTYNDIKKIVLRKKSKKAPVSLRTKILKRDNHKCVLCGATAETDELHVDHIIPTDRGGLTEERNLRVLCSRCNFGKSNKPFLKTG